MTGTTIDFRDALDADDLHGDKSVGRSMWARRLQQLQAGIEAGRGDYDVFYRIGEFQTASGARTAARNIERRAAKHPLPAVFDLESRIVVDADGVKTSELWAAMPHPDLVEEEF